MTADSLNIEGLNRFEGKLLLREINEMTTSKEIVRIGRSG